MGTSYPVGIDNFTNPTGTDTLDSVTVPHATEHANLNDAVEAIETELGTNPSGSDTDVASRLAGIDTTLSGLGSLATLSTVSSSEITWPLTASGYLDMNTNDLYGVGRLAVGALSTTTSLSVARTATGLSSTYSTLKTNDSLTWSSGGLFAVNVFDISGSYTFNGAPLGGVNVFSFRPSLAGSATYAATCVSLVPSIGSGVTLSSLTCIKVAPVASGTITTTVGIQMTSLPGSTVWGLQVGDYQSYHQGKLALGGTTAPTWGLHLEGTAQDRGAIGLADQATTPTSPASSSEGVIYVKGGKLVVAYNDAGTVRYKYLTLSGTGTTWTATTTAP